MKIFDWKNIDIFVFGFFPGIAIVVISVVLADSFRQGVLLFAISLAAYFAILLLLQGVLLFLPSYRKKFKEYLKRQQSKDPSFGLCLYYPDHEEEIIKKIKDFLFADENAKNKILAMVITAAKGARILKPKFNRTVVAEKFGITPNELSRNLNRKWDEDEEKDIKLYQKEFLEMKKVFDAAEESKKTK